MSVVSDAVDNCVCQVVHLGAAEPSQANPAVPSHEHRVLVCHVIHLSAAATAAVAAAAAATTSKLYSATCCSVSAAMPGPEN